MTHGGYVAEYTDAKDEQHTQVRIDIAEMKQWREGMESKLDDILTEVRKNGETNGAIKLKDVDTKWIIIGLLVWLAPDAAAIFLTP